MTEDAMLLALICTDNPGMAERRVELRPEHKAHVARIADQLAFAGPLLADDGQAIVGSLIVAEFADKQAAQDWLDQEPYFRNGVYGSVQIRRFANYWPQRAGFPQ